MKNRKTLQEYKAGILAGDRAVLGQAITLVESSLEEDQRLASALLQEVLPHTGNSLRLAVTGVPGVGKSSFIETFGKLLLKKGKKVAVLAIDPSSSLSQGSILGDKTRMEGLSLDKRAYIRPSPSRSALGGVGAKTREAILFCEAAGFDLILVETVGVGQSETSVKHMVDFFLLLLLSGAGDELQGIKKGIMEMADQVVIHKADGEALEQAKRAKATFENALHFFPPNEKNWNPKVILASSLTGLGMDQVWETLLEYQEKMKSSGFWEHNRAQQRLFWLDEQIKENLTQVFLKHPGIQETLKKERDLVQSGKLNPSVLAERLVQMLLGKDAIERAKGYQ